MTPEILIELLKRFLLVVVLVVGGWAGALILLSVVPPSVRRMLLVLSAILFGIAIVTMHSSHQLHPAVLWGGIAGGQLVVVSLAMANHRLSFLFRQ